MLKLIQDLSLFYKDFLKKIVIYQNEENKKFYNLLLTPKVKIQN